ncbi:sensor histidine kinase [Streptomyces sp. NPDC018026]|uniref:sensor histidine kinase n=1 Tax=Streptomyces sp. NPDC018026 TaxID=3365031 RepID=UPI0037B4BCD6
MTPDIHRRSARLRAAVAQRLPFAPAPEGLRQTRWAWAADALLALVLAIGVVSTDLDRSFVEVQDRPNAVWQQPGDVPAPPRPVPPPDLPRAEGDCPPEESAQTTGPQVCGPGGIRVKPALEHSLPPVQWWELALGVLAVAPLALRRRRPLAVLWAVLAGVALFHLGAVSAEATAVTFGAVLIAAYSAAMYSPHRRTTATSLLAAVGLLWQSRLVPDVSRSMIPLLVLVPVALAANALHAWQQRVHRMQREQEAATRLAVDQERHRIARELHDVVTHNVSMMTIQAGAARKVLDASPAQAREAMLAVEAAGRSAMTELRQVMGLLTTASAGPDPADPAESAELAPQPGLDRLEDLVARVRATGTPVVVRTEGEPPNLPPGVDLAAYRVVQEGLTNAVRHASGAEIAVKVEYAPNELRIVVEDSGGVPLVAEGNGRGLIGLRERLAVYGGTLHTGKRPRGGYRIRAVVPLEVR